VQNGAHRVLFWCVGIGLERASSDLVTLIGIVLEAKRNGVLPKLRPCNSQVRTQADISTLKLVTGHLKHIADLDKIETCGSEEICYERKEGLD
jgi:hypothetical protein